MQPAKGCRNRARVPCCGGAEVQGAHVQEWAVVLILTGKCLCSCPEDWMRLLPQELEVGQPFPVDTAQQQVVSWQAEQLLTALQSTHRNSNAGLGSNESQSAQSL